MKNILLLIALVCSISAFGQNTIPYPGAQTGQMPNLSSSRTNATLDTANASTLYLTTGKFSTAGVPALYPLIGGGSISFTNIYLKASTTSTATPTVVSTLQRSYSGATGTWGDVPGATVFTVTPTSATVPLVRTWDVTYNLGLYYRTQNVVTVDTASMKAFYFQNNTRGGQ